MFRDFTRVQQRLLGLSGPLQSRPDAVTLPIERVVFSPDATALLHSQAYATGSPRGGPLFGSILEGEVRVVALAPGGVQALDAVIKYEPLRLDPAYVLGWSDSLAVRYGRQVDWVGNWIMHADGLLDTVEEDLRWLKRGAETDLFNERYFMFCFGWNGVNIQARACLYDRLESEPTWLEIDMER